MYKAVRNLVNSSDFSVVESFEIAGRPARFAPTPQFLLDSPVGAYLNQEFASGLWKHQAEALDMLGNGRNVVVSTGTASGKESGIPSAGLPQGINGPVQQGCRVLPAKGFGRGINCGVGDRWRSLSA